MKPLIHAQMSAKTFGGKPEDYLHIHDLMDIGKSSLPDVRHRALFHHNYGGAMVEKLLGHGIMNSDNKLVSIKEICDQHVVEDLSYIPDIADYFACIPEEDWYLNAYNAFMDYKHVMYKEAPDLYQIVYSFLLDPQEVESFHGVLLVSHALFPYIVEKAVGVTMHDQSTRDLVENHIRNVVEIYPLSELLENMTIEDWMIRPEVLEHAEKQKKVARIVRPQATRTIVNVTHKHYHSGASDSPRYD